MSNVLSEEEYKEAKERHEASEGFYDSPEVSRDRLFATIEQLRVGKEESLKEYTKDLEVLMDNLIKSDNSVTKLEADNARLIAAIKPFHESNIYNNMMLIEPEEWQEATDIIKEHGGGK